MPKLLLTLCIAAIFAVGCDNSNTANRTEAGNESRTSTDGEESKPPSAETATDAATAQHVEVTPSSGSQKNPATQGDIPKSSGDIPLNLKFLSWNVESEGSEPATIVRELTDLGQYDVITLTEVLPKASRDFCTAFGEDYNYIMGETGRNDRMMVIYNKQALKYVRKFELDDINYKSRYRSPLVVHFKDMLTGKELLVMVNHLARGSAETRQIQAEKLVKWARDETMPIVALGDYNFDYDFKTRKGNESFRLFMKDNVFEWVEPVELIDTNWYDNPEQPDGKDDYPGSMLDFGFVAGSAKDWTTSCKVIVRDGDFPDNEKTSDHRPFEMIVSGN